jgi:hypothetical protein
VKPPIPIPPPTVTVPYIFLVDAENPRVVKSGTWERIEDVEAEGASYLRSKFAGDKISLDFNGTALWVRFKLTPDSGKAKVKVGQTEKTLDLYSPTARFQYINLAANLPSAQNNVTITVTGESNPSSTDTYVCVDTFAYRTVEQSIGIHSIDYIDLINTINTINKILGITTIDTVTTIDTINTIKRIADAPFIANIGQTMNNDFESGNLAGWFDPAGIATVSTAYPELTRGSKYSVNLKASSYGIIQIYTPPFPVEAIVEASVLTLSESPTTEQAEVRFFFTDGLQLGISLDRNTIAKTWQRQDIWAKLQAALWSSPGYRGKHVYAIWFRNQGTTDGLYIDLVNMLVLPPEHMLKQKTLKDLTLTVASGATSESDEAGAFPVETAQTLGLSLEYKSSAALTSANSSLTINVKLKNADGTVNQTLSYTIPAPQRPGTDWAQLHFYKKIPSAVAYATITATFTNAEATSITINIRNIKAWPVPQTTAETRWSIPREPKWIDGAEATAPAAGTALVSVTVGASPRTGRVFGVHITAGEANSFQLVVGTTVVKRFTLGTAGTIHIVLNTPLADNIPAGTTVKIVNVNAGSTGVVYQASLLYDEG